MQAFFHFLATNPYILLFVTVGLAVWIGRQTIAGYGLGMVAAAIIVGCGALGLGLGLRREARAQQLHAPALLLPVHVRGRAARRAVLRQQPRRRRHQVHLPGVRELHHRPRARGARREALRPARWARPAACWRARRPCRRRSARPSRRCWPGRSRLPPGTTPEQVNAMIALSYGITYIWGTVGIILICKYLPKWWGVDAKAAARDYEKEHGVASGDVPALSGWTAGGLRAYRLENDAWVGKTLYDLLQAQPRVPRRQSGAGRHGARRRPGNAAEAGRHRRARRQARGHDREDGPDRPRGLRPGRPRRAAGQGRDPRHQQRAPEEDARGMARPAGRRSGPGRRPRALAACRSRSAPIPSCSGWTSSRSRA